MRFLAFLVLLGGCPAPSPGVPTDDPVPTDPTPTGEPQPTDPTPVPTVPLRVVGYNVESGGAEAATVAANIRTIQGESIWGFSECANGSWLDAFVTAAADDASQTFDSVLGTTGYSDRLALAWDTSVVTYESHQELHAINIDGNGRAPLVATFTHQETGIRFKVMVNHLWRTNDAARHQQAELLNDWVRGEPLPVIALGDYNFDWHVTNGDADHDLGYDNLTADDAWIWVRPAGLIKTQCSFEGGVLDFVFAGSGAQDWDAGSDILLRGNVHCQPSEERPDHRPVAATFQLPLPE